MKTTGIKSTVSKGIACLILVTGITLSISTVFPAFADNSTNNNNVNTQQSQDTQQQYSQQTYQTVTETIDKVQYNNDTKTYEALTKDDNGNVWALPIVEGLGNDEMLRMDLDMDLMCKDVTIVYDDNSGSTNFEDWTILGWTVNDCSNSPAN